ncbi:MAG: disulfide bond formation protein B [Cardiobacteriaceae bacterium]|nr:disulfide bond formation protein B [Cardiobacteriaceae bacterium]
MNKITDFHRRLITAASGIFSWLAVIFAWLYWEKTLYLAPCPLCMMQRLAFVLAGTFFIFDAIVWNSGKTMRFLAMLGKYGGIFFGIGLAARHIHIQNLPADKKPSGCGFDFYALIEHDGFLKGLLRSMQGTGDCAQVDKFFGLALPVWSLIGFGFLILIAVVFGKLKN